YKKILCFPTRSKDVYRVKILLDELGLSPDFFTSLGEKTKEYGLEPVYNTGICTKESYCFWEGFFWCGQDNFDEEAFERELRDVVNVTGVEIVRMEK
ncbi:MAG: hypothetical protein ACTSU5_17690, partial [Promethearchaeota archaeon]